MFELKSFHKKKITKFHFLKISIWYLINNIIIYSFIPSSKLRIFFLKIFGASIGDNVVIHPYTNFKYPWKLEIGTNSWIGARAWIDNISEVKIGDNCCISQDVYFCTGNHNYKKKEFDLMSEPIVIGDNCWIGAKSILCPGVNMQPNTIVKINTVVKKNY
ncbi:colanic acid biosynthesis acetyltransferase WcaF [Pelagibacterales bacterium SAG-MED02]|nr:colanic acid biosynthesis acetyltransferase WcaF [Pelagibacterales bacterium SAG-MED02]